jgi:hypothetical protein
MAKKDADETIYVRESVYKAGQAIEELGAGDGFNAAKVLADYYRRAKDRKRAAFWKEIYDYLMTRECSGKDARTVIAPD